MATILLTGASSFSGLWIAEALAAAGHEVVAPLLRAKAGYDGIRRDRVERLGELADVVFETPFGSPAFNDLLGARRPGLLAHHAAEISNYRDPDYDPVAGLVRNGSQARAVAAQLAAAGARGVITTGTTFEPQEGAGEPGELAVTRYGLSQALTHAVWRHEARWHGLAHGRVVVAAPFGPYEEGRFAWSLFQNWLGGRPGVVRHPRYVRDNLPAPLLGVAYARLAAEILATQEPERIARPSGFVGTQGEFARRVAREAEARLGRPCLVEDAPQTVLSEPLVRVNSEPCLTDDWDAAAFWDAYVDYYLNLRRRGLLGSPA